MFRQILITLFFSPVVALCLAANGPAPAPRSADRQLADYFRAETTRLTQSCLTNITSARQWEQRRAEYRQQLFDMLGLWPLPERSDLRVTLTDRVEQEDFTVEKLHFQPFPGLYTAANLYLPKGATNRVPAILYACGHAAPPRKDFWPGNKTFYQHHGIWFARHGYACLVIDTLQLGEIPGHHHGTYREGQWWWNSLGYTPAGIEAWTSIRALDYLCARPEVDATRIGMTGRSGGGSYTWTAAALDDRIKVAAPVAGITDLQNQVVDGVIEGHCDCMFYLNTRQWDFPQFAALVAPRPLLIVNTDADTIFPLDGVLRVHEQVRRIYQVCQAVTNLGLVIAPGPHKDTQDLQVPVFRWFNKYLKGTDPALDKPAIKLFEPEQLKVFATIPSDTVNSNYPAALLAGLPQPALPTDGPAWVRQQTQWLAQVRTQCFGAWPSFSTTPIPRRVFSRRQAGVQWQTYDFESQPQVTLRLIVAVPTSGNKVRGAVLTVVAENDWAPLEQALAPLVDGYTRDQFSNGCAVVPVPPETPALVARIKKAGVIQAWVTVRGIGSGAWSGDARKQDHLRRRFMLLGQTLEGMRVWDVGQSVAALRHVPGLGIRTLTVEANETMAVNALYASLYFPGLDGLRLSGLPTSHLTGPDYFGVLKIWDIPAALAVAAGQRPVRVDNTGVAAGSQQTWQFPRDVSRRLNWPTNRLEIVPAPLIK
jgi:hypothetical protein